MRGHPIYQLVEGSLQRIVSLEALYVILEAKRTARYVQFVHSDRCLHVESVGDQFLPGSEALTPSQVSRLDELGWRLQPGENYVIQYPGPPFPIDEIAELLTRTLIEVHGTHRPQEIEITIDPIATHPHSPVDVYQNHKMEGYIVYSGLEDWWAEKLNEDECDRLEEVFQPMSVGFSAGVQPEGGTKQEASLEDSTTGPGL